MKKPSKPKNRHRRRVAISLEMDWGYRRHVEVYAGCQRYADEAGWDCFINPAVDRELKNAAKAGKAIPFDGVLARVTRPLAHAARDTRVPLVNVWVNSPVRDVPATLPDGRAAGVMAAEHLLGRGFRQFGFLGFTRDLQSRRQLDGFSETIEREGFSCLSHRFPLVDIEGKARDWESFVASLETWIDRWTPPIGILVTMDLISRYLVNICQSKGLNISQQVAIVGVGNEALLCDAPSPTLTSIDEGFAEIGYRAAAMLDRLMDGEPPPVEPEWLPPRDLIPRQSTDSFAADDPLVSRALRFIAEHSHERIEVKHVAAAVATTRRTLERRFRASLGRSIAGEITRLRLERAKRRMIETDSPLKNVAREAGFLTANHFQKTFTRIEGQPPSRYRTEHQRLFLRRSGESG